MIVSAETKRLIVEKLTDDQLIDLAVKTKGNDYICALAIDALKDQESLRKVLQFYHRFTPFRIYMWEGEKLVYTDHPTGTQFERGGLAVWALLQRIGERVRTLSRKLGGVGSRQGSDTFLIYCPHQENYSELLNQLSEDLTEDKDFTGKVQLRLGVYAEVDKNLDIKQRFDNAKLAADSVKREGGETVGFFNAEC